MPTSGLSSTSFSCRFCSFLFFTYSCSILPRIRALSQRHRCGPVTPSLPILALWRSLIWRLKCDQLLQIPTCGVTKIVGLGVPSPSLPSHRSPIRLPLDASFLLIDDSAAFYAEMLYASYRSTVKFVAPFVEVHISWTSVMLTRVCLGGRGSSSIVIQYASSQLYLRRRVRFGDVQ